MVLALALLLSAGPALAESDALLAQRLQAHVEFLASDSLRGRQPGTAGYDIAANYVASQFAQLGLQPAGTGNSYFQQVPLRSAWQEKGSARLEFERNGNKRAFEFVEEFYMGPDAGRAVTQVTGELVFVGYGIEAPELDYSDFGQIDVRGKIVVTLGGQPLD